MSGSSVGHRPKPRWEFDEGVAEVFDDMLERSIPQLAMMRSAVSRMARAHFREGTDVVDLGCSKGGALEPLVGALPARQFVGVERSPPMLAAARERFAVDGWIRIEDLDLSVSYPDVLASVTLCVLTLQFVPLGHRTSLLREAFRHTVPGGALILVEKVLGSTHRLNDEMVAEYHAMKVANGYSAEEVERKRLSLEGVLVPVTARRNEEMLAEAGFSEIDCFWRWMNFAGWVAVA